MEKNRIYKITDYGVIPNSTELQTDKIQAVFDKRKGEQSTIIFPKGTYLVGGLFMYSDTTLILEDGAIILGSDKCEDYKIFDIPKEVEMRSDMELIRTYYGKPWEAYRRAVISIYGGKNIKIIGQGKAIIDGNDCADPKGEEGYRGPHAIFITSVENLELSGYIVQNAGNFMHEINNSRDIHIHNVTCLGGSDGVHLHESKDILIENCVFRTGDDCVAGINMENLVVRNCEINTSCDAFRAGGNNILVENCHIWGPGLYPHRKTVVQNRGTELVRDKSNTLPLNQGRHNLITVWLHFASDSYPAKAHYKDISFRNCVIENPDTLLEYQPDVILQTGAYLSEITFENIKIKGLKRLSNPEIKENNPSLTVNIYNSNFEMKDGKRIENPFENGNSKLKINIKSSN